MIFWSFIAAVSISLFFARRDIRLGLFLVLLTGIVQDPVRKMVPGAPNYMIFSYLPVLVVVYFRYFSTPLLYSKAQLRQYPMLFRYMLFFVLCLLPGAITMLFNQGTGALLAIFYASFTYLIPFFMFLCGYIYTKHYPISSVYPVLYAYCIAASFMLSGGLLEYFNIFPNWQAIGTDVLATRWIKYISYGHTINLIAGFFRSPDIMGWHAAFVTVLSLIFLVQNKKKPLNWFFIGIVIWGSINLLLSGRSKMVAMPMLWVFFMFTVLLMKGRGRQMMIMAGVCGVLILLQGAAVRQANIGDDYLLNATVPFSRGTQRLDAHGVGAVLNTFRQSGFFGKGLGVATQGARNLGIKGSWQEGGLSKIVVELGAIGAFFFVLLIVTLARIMYFRLRTVMMDSEHAWLYIGTGGLLFANALIFIVSHQVYSDGIILFLLSFLAGLFFSSNRWCAFQGAR